MTAAPIASLPTYSRRRWKRWVVVSSAIFLLLIAILVAAAIEIRSTHSLDRLDGTAMEPTLDNGDILVGSTEAYDSSGPKTGDIIVSAAQPCPACRR